MAKRKGLSKKVRFEVFKRDSFTCQYCGGRAPDVVLAVDHIDPVANGGDNDILNLATACVGCNAGKSDRLLSDASVVTKQQQQLSDLQERREQIEMMLAWQRGLRNLNGDILAEVADFWYELAAPFSLTDSGKVQLKRLLGKFGVSEVLEAMRLAVEHYAKYSDGVITKESIERAWSKIGGICRNRSAGVDVNHEKDLYYIRGILRNRLAHCDESKAIVMLRSAAAAGVPVDELKAMALKATHWSEWRSSMEALGIKAW